MLYTESSRPVYCTDVWVHFQAPHLQGVHLNASDHITAIHRLAVYHEFNSLWVSYLDKDDRCRKLVTYNMDAVLDFTCEGVQTSPDQIYVKAKS